MVYEWPHTKNRGAVIFCSFSWVSQLSSNNFLWNFLDTTVIFPSLPKFFRHSNPPSLQDWDPQTFFYRIQKRKRKIFSRKRVVNAVKIFSRRLFAPHCTVRKGWSTEWTYISSVSLSWKVEKSSYKLPRMFFR